MVRSCAFRLNHIDSHRQHLPISTLVGSTYTQAGYLKINKIHDAGQIWLKCIPELYYPFLLV